MTANPEIHQDLDVSASLIAFQNERLTAIVARQAGAGMVRTAERLRSEIEALVNQEIPPRYIGHPGGAWRVSDFPIPWRQAALDIIIGPAWSIYLSGAAGSRKSTFAATVLRAWRVSFAWWHDNFATNYDWLRPCSTGVFLPIYAAAARLRDIQARDTLPEIWQQTPMLVIDDLGAARDTPHLTEQLSHLIQLRYDYCRKTVLTANIDLDRLASHLGSDRIPSRLQEGILLDAGKHDWRGGEGQER